MDKPNRRQKGSVLARSVARVESLCGAALFLTQTLTQALNVDPASNFFSGDNGVGFNYTLTERSVFRVFEAAIAKGLKVLVYNGDTDPGVNMVVIQDIVLVI